MKKHFQQIDVVKGLAIIAVLLLHSFPRATLLDTYAVFHIWQAVPVFMVVMGLNLGLSLTGKEQRLTSLYTRTYFSRKASRILVPFLQVFVFSLLIGFLWERFGKREVLAFDWNLLVGVLPVSGRGNYFITLLLQSILFLPIIGYSFQKKPVLTTGVLIALEASFLLWSKQLAYFDRDNYLYDAAFPRYFSAVAYGLWLAKAIRANKRLAPALPLVLLAALGAVLLYLILYTDLNLNPIRPEWQLQQGLTFGYAAWLVWLAFQLLPASSDSMPLQLLANLGRASYHVFLVQVVYFGLAKDYPNALLSLAICLSAGYLYFRYEDAITAVLAKPIGWLKASKA
mgnify:FL=1